MNFIIKGMITMLITSICTNSSAMFADCYSNAKQIYHGKVDNVYFYHDLIALFDYKKNTVIYVRAECVISDSISIKFDH